MFQSQIQSPPPGFNFQQQQTKQCSYPMNNYQPQQIMFVPNQPLSSSPPQQVPMLVPQSSTTSTDSNTQAFPIPPFQPVLIVQTANGPVYQPVQTAYFPNMLPQIHPVIPHPVMLSSDSMKRSKSNGSMDGRSSFDGSEGNDSCHQRSGSGSFVRGYSYSDVSLSRDGVGSDYLTSETDETPKIDVDSPDKMFYPTGPGNNMVQPIVFDASQAYQPQGHKKSNSSKGECNHSSHQSYSNSYLMQAQAKSESANSRDNSDQRKRAYYSDHSGKKRPTSKERQEELYKTELCSYWINGQKCRFGKRCIFAHGQHELRRPKRKVERSRLKPAFKKQVANLLNKMTLSNYDSFATDLLCVVVEDVREEKGTLTFVKTLFNKAVSDSRLQPIFAELWRKLLNVHPMAKTFATQMMDLCVKEYSNPRQYETGFATMTWISHLCSKKVVVSEELAHRILSDMFVEEKSEEKVEYWCKLIEALKNKVDTSKYFPQLNKLKTKFGSRVRFMIMDLEDLKKRNWVKRE